MKLSAALHRRLHWLNLPGALLLALLQRTPVLRVAATAEELIVASPVGTVLRSAVATVASLGALHSLAGATKLVVSPGVSVNGTAGTVIASAGFTVTGALTPAGSFRITNLPPGLSVPGANSSGVLNLSSGFITGTPTTAGNFVTTILAFEFTGAQGDAFGPATVTFHISAAATSVPVITTPPISQAVLTGGGTIFSSAVTGTPTPTFKWSKNGSEIPGATSATLSVSNVQPDSTGLFTLTATNSAGTVTTDPVLLGVDTMSKVVGAGAEVASDIFVAFNNKTFDQVLLSGAAATITADPGQITRISFIDLSNDIVQVEFGGAGTLSLLLDNPSGPAAPTNYNQDVNYMKGHAGIVITGANETTNVSVFSVGKITAVNQALFKSDVTYDGMADVAFIAIASTNGQFGGVRTANASYFATKGLTGIYAPGVQFNGPVFIGDINATVGGTATPAILLGFASDTRITGGDLLQGNGQSVKVSGVSLLKFVDGTTSQGALQPAQTNQATFLEDGADVTARIVVNPSP